MKIDYNKELVEFSMEFMDRLKQSFKMSDTRIFTHTTEIKKDTKLGYSIEEDVKTYEGKSIQLIEFPFKWGIDSVIEIQGPNTFASTKRDFIVPHKEHMKYLYEETIKNKDAYFDTIIAKLLLQNYIAIQNIDRKNAHFLVMRRPITDENSSEFGCIDYVEYIFMLTVFTENEQDKIV